MNLNLFIISPEATLFEGEVEAITSINNKGTFDVLPLHENFITIIKDKVVIHHKIGGEKKDLTLNSGIIKVSQNRVNVFVGIETL